MHCWHFPCFFHFTSDIYIIHYTLLRYYSSLLICLKGHVWIFSTPRLIETFLGWNAHEDENATWMLTVLHTNINMLIKNFYCFLLWFVSANTEGHVSETWLGDCTPSLTNSFQGDSRLFNWCFFLYKHTACTYPSSSVFNKRSCYFKAPVHYVLYWFLICYLFSLF